MTTVLCLILFTQVAFVRPIGAAVPAFLPMVDTVAPSQPGAIDGDWTISLIGKRIRIESGRAYALDSWLHAFVLQVQPRMVVVKNIRSDGYGGFVGEDLPLLGNWTAKPAEDGALDVHVAGALGPVTFRLLPAGGNPGYVAPLPSPVPGPPLPTPIVRPTPSPIPPPPAAQPGPISGAGRTLTQLGRNCIKDFEPMAGPMLRYFVCQKGLGTFNALKETIKAKKPEDAKRVVTAASCSDELKDMTDTLLNKGFNSFSLGVSGEVSIGVGGTGEYMVAMNIKDLSDPTLYATVGAGLGVQLGGSVNGVVSAYYDKASKLSGGGKSFAVALAIAGGGGAAVGISNGRSPRCESFSASAGVGGLANSGSISTTYTAKLIKFPSPDFTPSCKDVIVKATNRTGRQIKIIDVDFYDYANRRWRSKAIKNTKVNNGKSWTKRLRLQKVGGDRTRVRVQYRARDNHSPLNPWSKVRNKETGAKVCKKSTHFSAELR